MVFWDALYDHCRYNCTCSAEGTSAPRRVTWRAGASSEDWRQLPSSLSHFRSPFAEDHVVQRWRPDDWTRRSGRTTVSVREFPLSANNFASVACSYIIFSSLSVAVLYVGADFGFALPEFRGIKFCDNDELLSSLKTSLFRMQIFTGWRNDYARFVTTDLNIENVK